MLIDASAFASFLTPCRVSGRLLREANNGLGIIRLSMLRRWEAYQRLREIKHGVLVLSDIGESNEEVFFDVEPSDTYEAIKLALSHDLVWSGNNKAVDYRRTVERWSHMLDHDQISVAQVEKMKSNDLDAPEFLGFNVTLMEYLLTCDRRGARYYRSDNFEAIRH